MSPVALAEWWPVARGAGSRMRLRDPEEEPSTLPSHVGLWLDRMLAEPYQRERQEWLGRRQLYSAAVRALAPRSDPPAVEAYRPLFAAWRSAMESPLPGIARRTITIEAKSRILLHPASSSTVTEGSVLLHHTYGVPYIPGSALKGALRSCLDRSSIGENPAFQELPGEILGDIAAPEAGSSEARSLASLIDFHDALWIPEAPPGAAGDWSPLALDIVNPHHPKYYTGGAEGRRPPSDMDEPIPVHRLSLRPGTRFLAVAEAPDLQEFTPWLTWLIDEILVAALAEDGIGAWTSSGYGRLERVGKKPDSKSVKSSPAPQPAATPEEWQAGHIFYEAGSGELRSSLADGRRARASREKTQELLASLSGGLRTAVVKRKREVVAEVKVSPEGLNWKIVAVREIAK